MYAYVNNSKLVKYNTLAMMLGAVSDMGVDCKDLYVISVENELHSKLGINDLEILVSKKIDMVITNIGDIVHIDGSIVKLPFLEYITLLNKANDRVSRVRSKKLTPFVDTEISKLIDKKELHYKKYICNCCHKEVSALSACEIVRKDKICTDCYVDGDLSAINKPTDGRKKPRNFRGDHLRKDVTSLRREDRKKPKKAKIKRGVKC